MTKYKGKVQICSKSKKIDVRMIINLEQPPNQNEVVFYLPSKTVINEITAESQIEYTFQDDPNWCPFVLGEKKLTISLKAEKTVKNLSLVIDYSSMIDDLPDGGMNQFDDNIVEIGVYVPWFPLQPHFPKVQFDVLIDDAEKMFIGGGTENVSNGWRLASTEPTVGYPIIGAKDFWNNCKSILACNSEIRVFYTDQIDMSFVNSVHDDIRQIIELYSKLFGETRIRSLDLYLSPRKNTDDGGGYCRPGLIVLPCGENTSGSIKYTASADLYLFKYLAHELGHLWWNNAQVHSWENWINESFAEYSCLLAIRELKCNEEFVKVISEYESKTSSLGPIKNCTIENENHFEIWYMKGPALLSKLELHMGEAKFYELLRQISTMNIGSTDNILSLLEPDDRAYFINLISFA